MANRRDDGSRNVEPVRLTEAEARSRRARNIAIGLAVVAFCFLVYAITLAKLGSAVLKTS